MSFSLFISKEYLKFSAAHFTIFDAKTAERLHGHNYQVSAKLEANAKDGLVLDFKTVKTALKQLCDQLDEYVLIPEQSKHLKITKAKNIQVQFLDKTYSFPAEDVLLLPIENITTEALAQYLCEKFLKALPPIKSLTITVQETSGQSASYTQ